MNTNIEVLRELDELVEAARLLGVTQAKNGFGCHTDEDSRFERAMYESIDKHRAALLAERDALAAEVERLAEALRMAEEYINTLREALTAVVSWFPSADTYRRLGFDPEPRMQVLKEAKAVLFKENRDEGR